MVIEVVPPPLKDMRVEVHGAFAPPKIMAGPSLLLPHSKSEIRNIIWKREQLFTAVRDTGG